MGRRVVPGRRSFAFVLVCALVSVFGACASSDARREPIDVVVVGDSLLYESKQTMREGLPGVRLEIHAFPGGALCDFLPVLRTDLERSEPSLVVIETVGNSAAPCLAGAGVLGSKTFADRYTRDLRELVNAARASRAEVLIVDPPPIGGLAADSNAELARLGARWRREFFGVPGVHFTDGPPRAVSDQGQFAATLPCLAEEGHRPECNAGRIAVRDPYFGLHFCRVLYPDDRAFRRGCTEYSSGAVRYGRALADAIRALEATAPD